MRKLLEKGDSESKKRKNSLIVGIGLVVLMLFSTFGYAFYSSSWNDSEKGKIIEYSGLEFEQTSYGSWRFNIQDFNFETSYNPLETENISVITSKTLQDYTNLPLYFGIKSDESINSRGISELVRNLDDFILRTTISCMNDNCTGDYPIKNCSDGLVVFEKDEFLRIRDDDGCVYIYTSEDESERVADAFLYKILGVQ